MAHTMNMKQRINTKKKKKKGWEGGFFVNTSFLVGGHTSCAEIMKFLQNSLDWMNRTNQNLVIMVTTITRLLTKMQKIE